MNLIVTLRVFSAVFLGVLAAFAAPNPQSDGCVPFPCGPFTCPPADQNDQALISSSANSTTLTCVYQRLEVPCVYMQSDGRQFSFVRGCFVQAIGPNCDC